VRAVACIKIEPKSGFFDNVAGRFDEISHGDSPALVRSNQLHKKVSINIAYFYAFQF
jgi:hypothetical protein